MFAEALDLLCHLEWSHSNMTDGMQPGAKKYSMFMNIFN